MCGVVLGGRRVVPLSVVAFLVGWLTLFVPVGSACRLAGSLACVACLHVGGTLPLFLAYCVCVCLCFRLCRAFSCWFAVPLAVVWLVFCPPPPPKKERVEGEEKKGESPSRRVYYRSLSGGVRTHVLLLSHCKGPARMIVLVGPFSMWGEIASSSPCCE